MGAGVAGLADEVVEVDPGEQGQEQEQASEAGPGTVSRCQAAGAAVGDGGVIQSSGWPGAGRGPPARPRGEKGGGCPAAQPARNCRTC